MKKRIADLIEDKVQDIFFEMQEELDIKNGCVDFGDAFELDDLQEKLAVCIEKILNFQIEVDKEEEVTR